jgi:hypothetical protein
MKKFFVAIRHDMSLMPLIATSKLQFFLEKPAHPTGETEDLYFLYLLCTSVSATDLGMFRMESPTQKDAPPPHFAALTVPAHLVAWVAELEDGQEFPIGFLGSVVAQKASPA